MLVAKPAPWEAYVLMEGCIIHTRATDCVKVIHCIHSSSILQELRHFIQKSSSCWINCVCYI